LLQWRWAVAQLAAEEAALLQLLRCLLVRQIRQVADVLQGCAGRNWRCTHIRHRGLPAVNVMPRSACPRQLWHIHLFEHSKITPGANSRRECCVQLFLLQLRSCGFPVHLCPPEICL